jgi:hypothetical protein
LLAVVSGENHAQFPILSQRAAVEEERERHDTIRSLWGAHDAPALVEIGALGPDCGRNNVGDETLEVSRTLRMNRLKN